VVKRSDERFDFPAVVTCGLRGCGRHFGDGPSLRKHQRKKHALWWREAVGAHSSSGASGPVPLCVFKYKSVSIRYKNKKTKTGRGKWKRKNGSDDATQEMAETGQTPPPPPSSSSSSSSSPLSAAMIVRNRLPENPSRFPRAALQLDATGKVIKEFRTATEAGKYFCCDRSTITRIVKGKSKMRPHLRLQWKVGVDSSAQNSSSVHTDADYAQGSATHTTVDEPKEGSPTQEPVAVAPLTAHSSNEDPFDETVSFAYPCTISGSPPGEEDLNDGEEVGSCMGNDFAATTDSVVALSVAIVGAQKSTTSLPTPEVLANVITSNVSGSFSFAATFNSAAAQSVAIVGTRETTPSLPSAEVSPNLNVSNVLGSVNFADTYESVTAQSVSIVKPQEAVPPLPTAEVARAPEVSETQTPLATSDFYQAGVFIEIDEVKQRVPVSIEACGKVPVPTAGPPMGQCVIRQNSEKGSLAEVGSPLLISESGYTQSVRCQSGAEGVNVSEAGDSVSLMWRDSFINTANYPQPSPTHDAAASLAALSSLSAAQATEATGQLPSFSHAREVHDQGLKRPWFGLDTDGTNTAPDLIGLVASHQPPANLSKSSSRIDGDASCKRMHRDPTDDYGTSAFEQGIHGDGGSEMDDDEYTHNQRKGPGVQQLFRHTHPPLSSGSSLPSALHSLSSSLSSSSSPSSSLPPPTQEFPFYP